MPFFRSEPSVAPISLKEKSQVYIMIYMTLYSHSPPQQPLVSWTSSVILPHAHSSLGAPMPSYIKTPCCLAPLHLLFLMLGTFLSLLFWVASLLRSYKSSFNCQLLMWPSATTLFRIAIHPFPFPVPFLCFIFLQSSYHLSMFHLYPLFLFCIVHLLY